MNTRGLGLLLALFLANCSGNGGGPDPVVIHADSVCRTDSFFDKIAFGGKMLSDKSHKNLELPTHRSQQWYRVAGKPRGFMRASQHQG